ncbi:unnamed protein product [Adineta steineri]|uniref:F-box domain-containing protein n=2 Tax=Adineta steineri TaxID=433720 RepID=A0A814J1C5_9BILA|nr:unnamed protein product [Adineta steineri]
MSSICLLDFPVEILHRIFDYLDTRTIIRSLRCICRQLNKTVNIYNRYEIDLTLFTKVQCDNIISLIFSADFKEQSDKADFLLTILNIQQFPSLRSLTLLHINKNELDRFLPYMINLPLISLSIQLSGPFQTASLSSLSTAITQWKLQKLHVLDNFNLIKILPWPIDCNLNHLTITSCTDQEYHSILEHSPFLRTFVMEYCLVINTIPSVNSLYPQLTSLEMNYSSLSFEQLNYLLSLTPSLVHLKLINHTYYFSSLFDGNRWEELIQSKLRLLKNFQFCFRHTIRKLCSTYTNLHSIIKQYRTPFWFDIKRWFVIADCIMRSSSCEIILYTIPITIGDFNILIRCKAFPINDLCYFTKNFSNENNPDIQEDKTLIELNLENSNKISKDMIYLACALKHNTTIVTLNLNNNNIEREGLQYLIDALENNTTLTTLRISRNQIRDEGLRHLTNALQHNTTLTIFDYEDNHISNNGIQHLCDVLRKNTVIPFCFLFIRCLKLYFEKIISSIPMSSICLLDFPVEIFHRIFDYLDTRTIIRSLRCVCRQLNGIVSIYNRYEIDLTLFTKVQCEFILQSIRCENIISLIFSADFKEQSDKADYLLTILNIQQFPCLRSLTLLHINKNELDRFLPYMINLPLISLSIQLSGPFQTASPSSLSTAITQWKLRKLHIFNGYNLIQILPWPVDCNLNHLTITSCTDQEYRSILEHSPFLRTFVMEYCLSLHTLELGSNQIDVSKVQHLANMLEDNMTLTTLSLRDNELNSNGTEYLANALQKNTTLRILNLRLNHIDDNGAEYLANTLMSNTTLTTLYLWNNQIRSTGARYLADALQKNTTVTTLDLGRNQIGTAGTKYLADMLRINSTLTTLSLWDNEIKVKGAEYLATALKTNKTLTTLDMGFNQIGDNGEQYLLDTLHTHKTLTTLSLWDNEIKVKGAEYLAAALKTNKTLTTLDMGFNQIGDNGEQYLLDTLHTYKTLITLNLDNNPLIFT